MNKLPSLNDIGRLAKARRQAEGLSQKDLAALARVHHTVVVNMEKGGGNVRLANAWAVLLALGLAEGAQS